MRTLFFGRDELDAKASVPSYPRDEVKRQFVVGDLVSRFVPRRSRTKAEDVWSPPARVVKVIGDRT